MLHALITAPWFLDIHFIVFSLIIVVLLFLDLQVFHQKDETISIRNSLMFSLFYIVIALLFGLWIWHDLGAITASEYIKGYILEKTLALDNIFLISVVFTNFNVPKQYQHRVLFYGILGAIVFRALLIIAGSALVHRFEWILYLFSFFLIHMGIQMLRKKEEKNLMHSAWIRWIQRYIPVTSTFHQERFFVKTPQGLKATPLWIALMVVECIDIIFALDSIPAIFNITRDVFVVLTSNVFAILGLRSLYFALDGILHRFHYLKHALSMVLIFIGSKIFIAYFLGLEKFPVFISLAITVGLIGGGIVYSLYQTKKKPS